jgi:hypothetical protein
MERSRGPWWYVVIAIVVLVGIQVPRSHAQLASAEAEALFRQGKELMAANKIADACTTFDLSQKLDPKSTTLLNQANCREQNGQLATAWALYLEAVRQMRTATDAASQQLRSVAADRAARLERRLSTLRIDVPAESSLPGLQVFRNDQLSDPGAWNRPLPLDGGTYRISARAPGAVEWSSDITVAAEGDAKQIVIPRLKPAEVAPGPGPGAGGGAGASGPRIPTPQGSTGVWTTRRKLAAGLAGGGVLAVAVGGVLGASARSKQSDAHALCPSPQACDGADRANDLIRSGHNLAIGADVAFGVAAAAMLAAGALWFTGAPESPHGLAVVPVLSPGQAVLTACGSF